MNPASERIFSQGFDAVMRSAGKLGSEAFGEGVSYLDKDLAAVVLGAMQKAAKNEIDLSSAILTALETAKRSAKKAGK